MKYEEHFKSRIIVTTELGDYSTMVEGKIIDEDEKHLYLSDALILDEKRVYRSNRVIINMEYIVSVDSSREGEIFKIALEKYRKDIFESTVIISTALFFSLLSLAMVLSSLI